MASISSRRIRSAFAKADQAPTAAARGKILEDLIRYIMGRVPGIRYQEGAILTANGSEELDDVFWNDRLPTGMPFLPWVLIFECKNWSRPVGSAEVGFFRMKIEERHLQVGILIAASGITGDADGRKAAHAIVDAAFLSAAGTQLIVLTRDELSNLNSTGDLAILMQNKISKIVIRASQFGA